MRRACSQPSLWAEPMPSLPGRTTTPTRGSAAARAASTSSVPSRELSSTTSTSQRVSQPKQAVEHGADIAALVVGADEHQRVAGFHRRRKLRTMRRKKAIRIAGFNCETLTRDPAGIKTAARSARAGSDRASTAPSLKRSGKVTARLPSISAGWPMKLRAAVSAGAAFCRAIPPRPGAMRSSRLAALSSGLLTWREPGRRARAPAEGSPGWRR